MLVIIIYCMNKIQKSVVVVALIASITVGAPSIALAEGGMVSLPASFLTQLSTLIGGMQSFIMEAKESMRKTDTKAANLRVALNALERQHVDLASEAVRSGFDGRADFKAAAGELDKNSVAIADAIASIYGPSAKEPFLAIWRSHIGFFVDYTVAAKGADKAGMDKAVKNLTEGYVPAIADFLSKANPNLPREAVATLVTDHVLHLKGAVDAYGAADYALSYKKQTDAYNQIGTIADALSGAIVKQFPEKF